MARNKKKKESGFVLPQKPYDAARHVSATMRGVPCQHCGELFNPVTKEDGTLPTYCEACKRGGHQDVFPSHCSICTETMKRS